MSTHTRVTIETVAYECSQRDCGHNVSPCPSTGPVVACRECTERSAEEYEGPVVDWDECQGEGKLWAELDED